MIHPLRKRFIPINKALDQVAGRGDLVLAISFEEGYIRFYDAAFDPESDESELCYWVDGEFEDEDPRLLSNIIHDAVLRGARIICETEYGKEVAGGT